MSKQLRGKWPVMILILVCLIVSGCAKQSPSASPAAGQAKIPVSETYYVFDTVVTVKVYDEKIQKDQFAHIGTILDNVELWLNRENKNSEIYKVNQMAGKEAVKVSPEAFKAVKSALQDSIDSNGVFDLTIGPIVSLWGVGQEGAHKPADSDIAKSLALVNYKEVTLDEANQTVKLNKPGMSLDIGGTGKGYAADLIAEYLESQGFHSAIIDMGGNLLTVGQKPDGSDWNIGIQNPDQSRGTSVGTVKVGPMAIVASGIYERFFIENGVRYHHIMDTSTGAPVQNELASVTILTDQSAMVGEGLDNWVFALGLEKGLAYVDSREGVEAVFITKDQKVYVSKGLKGKLVMSDPGFTLMGE
ncbi:FAD:protein FMN transferase [Gorillibacterium timonense]|uniref:FAD:protein FMN transferase n=1 Tax=Gorillibacterium timonense TaxID=1689269 RepID=UPI00071DAD80|nr:FAD:protein FMN transferase [Gorillibacterium timonense]